MIKCIGKYEKWAAARRGIVSHNKNVSTQI